MFHSLLGMWFHLSLQWGYLGVFALMALESTVFPIPSEVVIPPAAYWATQGRFEFWGVVAAGTLGSWAGAAISYVVGRALGRPLILRFGKFVGLTEHKWETAEHWIQHYSTAGVFLSRMLPVVRHLISLPAGAGRAPFGRFTLSTLAGSLIWCFVLAWFGARVLAGEPRLLDDPAALQHLLREKLLWFVLAALVLLALYVVMDRLAARARARARA